MRSLKMFLSFFFVTTMVTMAINNPIIIIKNPLGAPDILQTTFWSKAAPIRTNMDGSAHALGNDKHIAMGFTSSSRDGLLAAASVEELAISVILAPW
jgi:hypothetical protein